MDKVIFDTNFLLEKRMKNFFGKQDELNKFSKVAEIIIPDMVIGELKERYKRDFEEEKKKFNKILLNNIATHNINDIKIEDSINSLIEKETIDYTTIELTDYSVLYKMKELALKKDPPFENKNGTDKGFKDTYIYFTILEYLQGIENKEIFFVTDDILFREAFKEYPSVVLIKNYEEFMEKNINILCDNYFIEKLKEEVDENIKKEYIKDYWINIDENYVFFIEVEDEKYVIEMDEGEIIDFKNREEYSEFVDYIVNSNDFNCTKESIDFLFPYLNFLSDDEIIKILEATKENENIHRIISNNDVKQLIGILYDHKKDIISSELKIYIGELLEE